MTEPRRCECHDEPMRWNKSARLNAGGYWRCAVRAREHDRSPKGVARKKAHLEKRIRVQIGDTVYSYPVDPERKDEVKARLAEFRAARAHDQEAPVGRQHPSVPRA